MITQIVTATRALNQAWQKRKFLKLNKKLRYTRKKINKLKKEIKELQNIYEKWINEKNDSLLIGEIAMSASYNIRIAKKQLKKYMIKEKIIKEKINTLGFQIST